MVRPAREAAVRKARRPSGGVHANVNATSGPAVLDPMARPPKWDIIAADLGDDGNFVPRSATHAPEVSLRLSRRTLLRTGVLASASSLTERLCLPFVTPSQAETTQAQTPQCRHALSLFDTIKYPADFKHFDYVNPDAPKGGVV